MFLMKFSKKTELEFNKSLFFAYFQLATRKILGG